MLSPHDNSSTRRRRWLSRIVLGLFTALALTAGYAFFIEPKTIEVTHHTLVGSVRRPLRIAHVTDVHTHGFGPREQSLVVLIRKHAPDVIVVTGDTVDQGKLEPARDLFLNLSAPLGVWIVRGNWERWTVREDERAFYTGLGARFLENAGVALRDDVWIAGLDDPSTGHPDLGKALTGAPAPSFKLVLMHAPDYFAEIAGLFDLALAGHTHGGQVWLPGYGPLWLPPGGRRYIRGWFTANQSNLFVSRGIGTSVLPVRLMASPELAIIDVMPR
jgi:predicted MPP superfamily phosphohydrolase